MPRRPEYVTSRARMTLYQRMWALAELDAAELALCNPFSPEDKTPYKTRNSMVKKRPKKNSDSLMTRMVETKLDLKYALLANDHAEALRCYFSLKRLLGY